MSRRSPTWVKTLTYHGRQCVIDNGSHLSLYVTGAPPDADRTFYHTAKRFRWQDHFHFKSGIWEGAFKQSRAFKRRPRW